MKAIQERLRAAKILPWIKKASKTDQAGNKYNLAKWWNKRMLNIGVGASWPILEILHICLRLVTSPRLGTAIRMPGGAGGGGREATPYPDSHLNMKAQVLSQLRGDDDRQSKKQHCQELRKLINEYLHIQDRVPLMS